MTNTISLTNLPQSLAVLVDNNLLEIRNADALSTRDLFDTSQGRYEWSPVYRLWYRLTSKCLYHIAGRYGYRQNTSYEDLVRQYHDQCVDNLVHAARYDKDADYKEARNESVTSTFILRVLAELKGSERFEPIC